MKVEDCLPYMSKMYLGRIIDSILKEGVPKGDENRLREQMYPPDQRHIDLAEKLL